ncbi:hypothetical protein RHODGE_RHODGE_02862 [Rhodoplanes serenus]|uniref:Uncharacterized protein n=1 Tax=Rhodoplanes serenus TaxID=200615 RepID=A0A447CWN7_9BRAD|nr:hypothetical protein [Rhodoplanes serenus]MBI5111335.1 hypothetical protein [Rhodovulum sp.]VCU09693.1 hypothetical protein RHODGE_RHODGE_02862 [Rhodoplanes serenus]
MSATATTAAPARSRRLRAGEYEAALRAAPRIYVQTAWGWQTVRADADEVRTILALTPAGDVTIEQAGADGVLLVQHARGFARPGEAPAEACGGALLAAAPELYAACRPHLDRADRALIDEHIAIATRCGDRRLADVLRSLLRRHDIAAAAAGRAEGRP